MDMLRKIDFQKFWFLCLTLVTLVVSSIVFTQTVEAKELQNVITRTRVRDGSQNNVNPERLRNGSWYDVLTEFDLTGYDNDLQDGDYFTFDLPAPMDVREKSSQFNFDGVDVGDVEITSNGPSAGGQVRVTFRNLGEWMASKGYTSVKGVKGNFEASVRFTSEMDNQTLDLLAYNPENKITVTVLPALPLSTYDGSNINYNKVGGLIASKSWESTLLGRRGNQVHAWRLRLNENAKSYDAYVVKDTIRSDGFQFIPESFKLLRIPEGTWTLSGYDARQAVAVDVADKLTFNDAYTAFTLNLGSIAGDGYYLTYDTTATNDGSIITNNVQATDGGTVIKPLVNRTNTSINLNRESTLPGSITVKGQVDEITIYKRDGDTHRGLNGATFELTDLTSGQVVATGLTATNDVTGVQGYLRFSQLVANHTYSLREITPPAGYDPSTTPFEFTVDPNNTAGLVKYWNNFRTPAVAHIEAEKLLKGRQLTDGEFTFELVDASGTVVATAKNDSTGKINFEEQSFTVEKDYAYTIREVIESETGITYDKKEKAVTVSVRDNGAGLEAEVLYQDGVAVFTNSFTPQPIKVSLEVAKFLSGRDLVAGEFEFVIKDEQGQVLEKVTNTADGQVNFSELIFDKVGRYIYTIEEVDNQLTGITYDKDVRRVFYDIAQDPSTGSLYIAQYGPEDILFENTFEEPTTTTTTTVAPTTTTESTTTTVAPTTTTESTTTTVAPTTTTEAPTTTVAPTTTTEAPTTTTESLTTTVAPPTTTEVPTTTTESPTTTVAPTTTTEAPMTTVAPTTTTESPTTTVAPTTTTESTTTTVAPTTTTESPTTTVAPTTTTESPTTTVAPTTTTESPTTTVAPTTTTESPTTTVAPTTTTESPTTTVAPVVTTEASVVTTEPPAATTEATTTTTEAPVVTTEVPPLTTMSEGLVTTEAPVVTTEVPITVVPGPSPTTTTDSTESMTVDPIPTTTVESTVAGKDSLDKGSQSPKSGYLLPRTGEKVGLISVIGLAFLALLGFIYYRYEIN
ncbi:Spy0128 family protein [Streptococcus rifensis]